MALIASGALLALAVAAGVSALRKDSGFRRSLAGVMASLPGGRPRIDVPAGTPLTIRLETALSTRSSRPGDRFSAVVVSPVTVGGKTAVPGGARISGRVLISEQPGKASGRGRLQLGFDTLTFEGHSYALGSRSAIFHSRSGADKDAAMIGGGAVAGGILGGILGDGAGDAVKGMVIGGAAGTAVSLMTRGPQLVLGAGQRVRFTLDRTIQVRESRPS